MRVLKAYRGLLVVPLLAFAYAGYALWELTTGPFQEATIIYTYVIATPMVMLGLIAVISDILKPSKAMEGDGGEGEGEDKVLAQGGARRVILVVLASLALVIALPYLGYVIGFLLYILFVLWAIELRNLVASLIIAVAMALVVHFVFAGLLGQDLPVGPLTFLGG
ncbi:MAG: tripartite tricarboxylate transporter TctB family protein [Alphaproteobacteria bacterium]